MPSALRVDQLGGANFGNYHLRNVASLHVGGSALATAILDVSGSKTATAGSAIGQNNTTTLVAAANNDILTAVRIAPTFTNGAFTGVENKALWVVSGLTDLDGNLEVAGTATFSNAVTFSTTAAFTGLITANAGVELAASQIITFGDGTTQNTAAVTGVLAGDSPTWTGAHIWAGATVTVDSGVSNSQTLTLRGFYDSDATATVTSTKLDMVLRNTVTSGTAYKLSVLNNGGTEVANIDQAGGATFNGGVNIGGGSFAAGRIFKGTADGFGIGAVTGTVYDLGIITANGGQYILANYTGSNNVILASAGNVSFGNTDLESWYTNYRVIEGPVSSVYFATSLSDGSGIIFNAYRDAGGYKYKSTGAATILQVHNNQSVTISRAESGTADTAATMVEQWVMHSQGGIMHTATNLGWSYNVYSNSDQPYGILARHNGVGGYHQFYAYNEATGNSDFEVRSSSGTGNAYGYLRNTAWAYVSDGRFKENLAPIDGLSLIRQLKPVWYTWNELSGREGREFGYIAQDIQQIPELANLVEDPDGDGYLTLKYERIGTVLAVAALQQVDDRVTKLEQHLGLLN